MFLFSNKAIFILTKVFGIHLGKKYISTCDDNGILNLDSSTSKSWAKGSRNFTDHIVGRNICRPLDQARKICHQMIYRSRGASYLSIQLILMEFILLSCQLFYFKSNLPLLGMFSPFKNNTRMFFNNSNLKY